MASDSSTLVKLRAVVKSKLTRFSNFVNNFNIDIDEIEDLIGRYERVQSVIDKFDDIQTKIDLACELDEASSVEREEFERSFYRCTGLAKKLINRYQAAGEPQQQNAACQKPQQTFKLPELKLPVFDGKYSEWTNFRDSFQSLVNSNSALSNIDKFQYLKTSLRGDAARVIQSVSISNQNYEIAWNKIVDRYEDKETIIVKHVKDLFELTHLSKESSLLLRQFADDISNHLESIRTLDESNTLQDRLLVHLLSNKLDHATKRAWETEIANKEIPTVESFLKFIIYRSRLLDKLGRDRQHPTRSNQNNNANKHTNSSSLNCMTVHNPRCTFCKNTHYIHTCQAFLALPVASRIAEAKTLKLCLNCLRQGHTMKDCGTTNTCKKCHRKHHTLLHLHLEASSEQINTQHTVSHADQVPTISNCASAPHTSTLLATASVAIIDHLGNAHQCRVLLDSGSQSNFITEEFCNMLNMPRTKTSIPVIGINQSVTKIHHMTSIKIKSNTSNFKTTTSCLIISKITDHLPSKPIEISQFKFLQDIRLADPRFYSPGKIDLLIGANLFWELLLGEKLKLPNLNLILQNTKFGWIISGSYNSSIKHVTCNVSINEKLYNQISKFWEIEKCEEQKIILSREERMCEDHFVQTTRRNDNGQFIVNIPFKSNISKLGASYQTALRRFHALENKLDKSPNLKQDYIRFMEEYEHLGHMNQLINHDPEIGYYLPHHAVYKESSTTTKLWVVFDASCKTTSGLSLNDTQLTGPSLQTDITSILLRFRQHEYVIKADIAKIYRQVIVDDQQRTYQKILWRASKREPIKTYQLNTLVYGTASAPFLAIRTLRQLAQEYQATNPIISNIINTDMYMDDLLTGAQSIESTLSIKQEITEVLATAGFELRKWQSNSSEIVNIDMNHNPTSKSLAPEELEVKTLGIRWDSVLDKLNYEFKLSSPNRITKRIILSVISQIFDPLGLIGPIVIIAKIILQNLWQISLSWDEPIPDGITREWEQFIEGLNYLNGISIPRKITCNQSKVVEIHGFCDASEAAYGACVYLRSIDQLNNIEVHLMCAKSRVAPLKRISLPRLELCGALLLARLIKTVRGTFTYKIHRETCWTDSTIALAWISGSPTRWKQFVAHRVSEIQELTNGCKWRHVPTAENPADLISRGVHSLQLKNSRLWWDGPKFLKEAESLWPRSPSNIATETPEIELSYTYYNICDSSNYFNLIERYSNFNKLRRVTAHILRFIENCKIRKDVPSMRASGPLAVRELHKAEIALIRLVQRDEFPHELYDLMKNKALDKKSKILSLTPFLDNNVLRVGGRLKNSTYAVDQKHPIILPSKHHFTVLLIRNEHERMMHAGIGTTLASLRNKYWPVSGRNSVRRVLRTCVPCVRNNPKLLSALMGDLPAYRLTPCRPFLKMGVDYAGPFMIKDGVYKRSRLIKAYIALFVCRVTKAVHIEVVGSLTTEAFLAALHRFIARRGMVSDMYSDNGNNFVGTNNELRNLKSFFESEIDGNKIVSSLVNNGISWHFIPPRTPHFGGLWESSIKSIKTHLKRIIGNANLSFEAFATVLTQIEAILNSRPLTPISSDPNDFCCLTPGHFLIGDTLLTPAHPDVRHIPDNRLSQWQHIQKLQQHFWARWSKEYISLLQQRNK